MNWERNYNQKPIMDCNDCFSGDYLKAKQACACMCCKVHLQIWMTFEESLEPLSSILVLQINVKKID